MRWLLLRAWLLVRDLAEAPSALAENGPNALAREDDVLDAWLDDDGMDATGL